MKLSSWIDYQYVKQGSTDVKITGEIFPVRKEKDPEHMSFRAEDWIYLLEVFYELYTLARYPSKKGGATLCSGHAVMTFNNGVDLFEDFEYGVTEGSSLVALGSMTFPKYYNFGETKNINTSCFWRDELDSYLLLGLSDISKLKESIELNRFFISGYVDNNYLASERQTQFTPDGSQDIHTYSNSDISGSYIRKSQALCNYIYSGFAEFSYNGRDKEIAKLSNARPCFIGEDKYKSLPNIAPYFEEGVVPTQKHLQELYNNSKHFNILFRADLNLLTLGKYPKKYWTVTERWTDYQIDYQSVWEPEGIGDMTDYALAIAHTETRTISQKKSGVDTYNTRGNIFMTILAYHASLVETERLTVYENKIGGSLIGERVFSSTTSLLGGVGRLGECDFEFELADFTEDEINNLMNAIPKGTKVVFYGYWKVEGHRETISGDWSSLGLNRFDYTSTHKKLKVDSLIRSPVMTWTGSSFSPTYSEALKTMARDAYGKALISARNVGLIVDESKIPSNATSLKTDFYFSPSMNGLWYLYSGELLGDYNISIPNSQGFMYIERGPHSRLDLDE